MSTPWKVLAGVAGVVAVGFWLHTTLAATAARSGAQAVGVVSATVMPRSFSPALLGDQDAVDLIALQPALPGKAEVVWTAMTPARRKEVLRDRPQLADRIAGEAWSALTREEKAGFMVLHPKFRVMLVEGWRALTPAQRRHYLTRHPTAMQQIALLEAEPEHEANLAAGPN